MPSTNRHCNSITIPCLPLLLSSVLLCSALLYLAASNHNILAFRPKLPICNCHHHNMTIHMTWPDLTWLDWFNSNSNADTSTSTSTSTNQCWSQWCLFQASKQAANQPKCTNSTLFQASKQAINQPVSNQTIKSLFHSACLPACLPARSITNPSTDWLTDCLLLGHSSTKTFFQSTWPPAKQPASQLALYSWTIDESESTISASIIGLHCISLHWILLNSSPNHNPIPFYNSHSTPVQLHAIPINQSINHECRQLKHWSYSFHCPHHNHSPLIQLLVPVQFWFWFQFWFWLILIPILILANFDPNANRNEWPQFHFPFHIHSPLILIVTLVLS